MSGTLIDSLKEFKPKVRNSHYTSWQRQKESKMMTTKFFIIWLGIFLPLSILIAAVLHSLGVYNLGVNFALGFLLGMFSSAIADKYKHKI